MPQWIYEEPYNTLSDKAKQIYMFLFDRRTLSIQHNWFDENGDVFVYYTNEKLMKKLNCSNKPIVQAKKELQEIGLLREVRQGINKPNRLYILGSVESTRQEVSKVHTINTNNIKTEYNHTDIINYKEAEKKSFSQIIKSSNVKINERQSQQLLEYIGLDNMTVDMIDYAIQLTEDAGAESFNYLNKILKSWKDKGLTSLDEAKEETSGFRDSKNLTSKTRFTGNAIEHEYQGELPF